MERDRFPRGGQGPCAAAARLGAWGLCAAALFALACAKVKPLPGKPGTAGHGGAVGGAGAGGPAGAGGAGGAITSDAGGSGGAGGASVPQGCQGPCTDFPAEPIIEPGVSVDAPIQFVGLAPIGSGPCITEPEDGALFPYNWLRPRVKFKPAVPGTLHEIRFHADGEANDLVVYTTNDHWEMPRPVWIALAAHVRDQPIAITVRARGGGAASVKFTVAPVSAEGNIVFWAADPAALGTPTPPLGATTLQGFAIGDEVTATALNVGDVQERTRNQNNSLRNVTCIGCHAATPDGKSVGFVDNFPWGMMLAGVEPGRVGLRPDYLTSGGEDAIRQPGLGIFSFSKAHWTPGDRIIVAPYYLDMPCGHYDQNNPNARLAWLNVEAPAVTGGCPVEGTHFGFIARAGDTRGAANPTWSPDGETIVYSSTNGNQDGRLSTGPSDLFQVPYNNRQGGLATPLPGAAEPDAEEYYPAFSPDGKLVVFDRVPAGGFMYANPLAELFVVPAAGTADTKALRLDANDPPACTGLVSPGVNNHWAKWSPPKLDTSTGKTYYWLIFSSNRAGTPPVTAGGSKVQVSQLYATAIVTSAGAPPQLFPAIYLWNQTVGTLNTTPAWAVTVVP